MITGGEDALYIARRLVVVASEDVGLADPQALPLVNPSSGFLVGTSPLTCTVGNGDVPGLPGDWLARMPYQPGGKSLSPISQ